MNFSKTMMRRLKAPITAAAIASLLLPGVPTSWSSSHSDAPLIKLDPQANLTDVYSFIRRRPSGEKVLVVEVNVRPFSEPGDGVMYEAFSDDARYSIHIANPTTGQDLQRYDFQFSPVGVNGSYKNLDTILRNGRGADVGGSPDAGAIENVGDNHQNFVQTYSVTKVVGSTSTVLGSGLITPPPNVGARTTPFYNDPVTGLAVSGFGPRSLSADRYVFQTTHTLPAIPGKSGIITTFAGPREDSFYADTPGIFDLLDPRILDNDNDFGDGLGQDGNGVDGFKGFNVLMFSIVIPVSDLTPSSYNGVGFTPSGSVSLIPQTGVGVYASVSRPRITLRSSSGAPTSSGPFIQVNRQGNPLFNEVLVALRDKDSYNRTSPAGDAAYASYAENPELAVLINAVFGTSFATTGRADLRAIYIPDVLRVNTTTDPIVVQGQTPPPGANPFNRLSLIGGDTATIGGASSGVPSGWPNGRRLGDDVVDIALTTVASGPTFSSVTVVGDNVAANDQLYNIVFPYGATPHAGSRHIKDSGVNDPDCVNVQ
jgi:hypothetical protein